MSLFSDLINPQLSIISNCIQVQPCLYIEQLRFSNRSCRSKIWESLGQNLGPTDNETHTAVFIELLPQIQICLLHDAEISCDDIGLAFNGMDLVCYVQTHKQASNNYRFLDAKHLYEVLMSVCLSFCMYVFLSPFFENFQKHIQ